MTGYIDHGIGVEDEKTIVGNREDSYILEIGFSVLTGFTGFTLGKG